MIKPFVAAAFAVASVLCVTAPATAQTGGAVVGTAPGKAAIAQTVKVSATITDIDKATRDVTLKGPQGNLMTVTAGPDVKNFDKLKVGDQVDLQYVEALTLELKKGGGMVVGRTEKADAVGAKKGESPGGAVGRQVTIVADVVAVDPAKQIVTLKGPKQTVDLRIPDPEQFKRIAKGDQVEAKFTQAFAVAVEPTAKK
jgi:Cu/Ag efflux protein CusF